jgi:hypothetical protein
MQANVSAYKYPSRNGGSTNMNVGGKLGYGITDKHTIKFRYEHLTSPDILGGFDLFGTSTRRIAMEVDFYELENKFRLKNGHAIGITAAYYSFGVYSFDPRYYMTFSNDRNTMEISVIPKVHVLVKKKTSYMPGVSLGFGFSNDLDRWAFRPEIGWDGYLSAGAALTINLGKK